MARRRRHQPPVCNACGETVEIGTTPEGDEILVAPVAHRWDSDPGGGLAGWYDEHLALRVRVLEQGERPEPWQKRRTAHDRVCAPRVEQTRLLVGTGPARRRKVLA